MVLGDEDDLTHKCPHKSCSPQFLGDRLAYYKGTSLPSLEWNRLHRTQFHEVLFEICGASLSASFSLFRLRSFIPMRDLLFVLFCHEA
jgi:hypothetical protein